LTSVALASIAIIVTAENFRMIFPVGRFEFARCMMWPAASLALLNADRAIATIDDVSTFTRSVSRTL
jgi:hypothetical protein